jgi:hypothetical protein
MKPPFLLYRFANAFREAIQKMIRRILAVMLTAMVAGLLVGAGVASAQLQGNRDRGPNDAVWYKPMPAIIPAASTVFGLYQGTDFRLTNGSCKDCPASKQALWYFRDDLVAVPSDGVSVGGFSPGVTAQEDVKRWYASATPEARAARPPMLWIGSTHFARDLTLTSEDRLQFADKRSVPFKTVEKIKTNLSFYNESSKAYFAQRPLRMRGELKEGAFVARTIWPQDWTIDEKSMKPEPLAAGESLLGLVRKHANGKDEKFETRLLWEKTPAAAAAARDWSGRAVIGIMLNGAQGDDDEAHGGHFAIATGRHAKGGDWSEWMVNNFYNLDSESEKGIIASMLPMDNYMADLNSGQSWYRPSYMLVAVLKSDRAPYAYQGAISRVYSHLYRHDFQYRHAGANCAGISMDTMRTLGWNIPLTGPTDKFKAYAAYPFKAFEDKSFASGLQAYNYLTEDQSRLYPAAAYEAAGRDLLNLATGAGGRVAAGEATALENLLREDLEALVFVRIPQLPSSRAFGMFPVATIDEYMKRAPADKAQWKIVPAGPRPFPAELVESDKLTDKAMPPERPAIIGGGVFAGMLVVGARLRTRSARKKRAQTDS